MIVTMHRVRSIVLIALGLMAGPGSLQLRSTPSNGLLGILQSELQRNLQVLKMEPVPAYFISYTVHDTQTTRILASFGAVRRSAEARRRLGSVRVRVGDYSFDNTHPIRGEFGAARRRVNRVRLPLADSEKPIRLELWRTTDRAYKQAAEALTRAKTNAATKIREEDPARDFSREDPQTHTDAPVTYSIDTKRWEELLRRVSAPFADDPLVFRNNVSLTINATNRYYTNSEGSAIATSELFCQLFIQAMTKADDGMELPMYASYFARTPEGLPDEEQLLADVRDMVTLLAHLRRAPLMDPFSGPAILSGRAAGVFFHELFGHRVEGHRQRNVDDAQTFANRVDQSILPSFLSVLFDPTRRILGGVELHGYYLYDDQGVKAQRVVAVDKGVLKTFLLGRAPLNSFPRSNGHGRAEAGFVPVSRQSNLIVESTQTVSTEKLMDMLKEEARKQGKPFGLLFDNIEGGFTSTDRSSPSAFNVLPNVVYRVYVDGRPPDLVRGVDLIGTPLSAFGKIVATSDTVETFNGMCRAESGRVPVSASSPALLVSEVEVQKKAQSHETQPILSAPQPRKKV